MTAALVGLLGMQLRGSLVRKLRQLRRPRYLLGLIVGGGWLLFWMTRWIRDDPGLQTGASFVNDASALGPAAALLFHVAASAALAVVIAVSWALPFGKVGLPLDEAELHVLLPAPVTRRQVVGFALLKSLPPTLLTVLIFTVLLESGGVTDHLATAFGLLVVFGAWELTLRARGLFLLRQRLRPRTRALRVRALLVALLVAYLGAIASAAWPLLVEHGPAIPAALDAEDPVAFEVAAKGIAEATALRVLLVPFLVATGPLFAPGGTSFAVAAALGLALVAVLHEVVVRTRTPFEERTLDEAQRQQSRADPHRALTRLSPRRRGFVPFRLPASGPPEVAIVWKNAIQSSRLPWRHEALIALAVYALVVLDGAVSLLPPIVPVVAGVLGFVLFAIVPTLSATSSVNDLRTDLLRLEVLRTWPVDGFRLVLAEVLGPTLAASRSVIYGAGLISAGYVSTLARWPGGSQGHERLGELAANFGVGLGTLLALALVGLAPLLVAVAFLSSAIQNASALAFPAWVPLGPQRNRGMAHFGQRLLFALAWGLMIVVSAIPAALLVGAAMGVQWLLGLPWSAWALPIWGALAALPLIAETLALVVVASRTWNRLDPSEELLQGSASER